MSLRRVPELESLAEKRSAPTTTMSRTLVTLLAVSLVLQTLIGLALLSAILICGYWLKTAIEDLNVEALSTVIQNVLLTSVNIQQLSSDALLAVHAASGALNETTTSLSRLNDILRHPVVSLTLPGLEATR